jgi:hypothetical protein
MQTQVTLMIDFPSVPSARRWPPLGAFALLLCTSSCSYSNGALSAPEVSAEEFAQSAYPILLRDCGFPACHGSEQRFFQVYGPGRTRLDAASEPYDPVTDAEMMHSFGRARSMLENVSEVEDSLLLRKPLSLEAGGAGHEGHDGWGQSVYASTKNPAYRALRAWATSRARAEQRATSAWGESSP